LRSCRARETFQNFCHLVRLKAVGPRFALISDSSFAVDDVKAVRPGRISDFSGIQQVIDYRRNLNGELGHALVRYQAALLEAPGAGHTDVVFKVIAVLPGVNRVRFHDVNHKKGHFVLVLVVEFVERGNLPAEGRSGVTAENQHHWLVVPK